MRGKDTQNKQVEDLLQRAHLSEPSPQLHGRITAAAKRAWNEAPEGLPWLIPFRRLVASAAAAVLIVWLADYSGDYMLAQWSPGAVQVGSQQPTDIEVLPEMPYSPFVRRLALVGRRLSAIDASALTSHLETLRHILDEALQGGSAKPQGPAGGRSRLIPDRPITCWYS